MTEDQYISQYSSLAGGSALQWLERQTHLRTNHARMLSGPVAGGFLSWISSLIRPQNVLELGVFTGYSTICLAAGLAEGGHIDSIEINDELEDLICKGYEKAGISSSVSLHFGDAKQIIPTLQRKYQLVYIDANKREYCDYYDLLFDKVAVGGVIIADNVLWDGKVLMDPVPSDAQSQSIARFNRLIAEDERVENMILPLRDGLNIIIKKNE